jgi:hypothetical protein
MRKGLLVVVTFLFLRWLRWEMKNSRQPPSDE